MKVFLQKKISLKCSNETYISMTNTHKHGRGGIRTHDLILKRDLLYRLSYTPMNAIKYIQIRIKNAIINSIKKPR